jgi:hypothetical protein
MVSLTAFARAVADVEDAGGAIHLDGNEVVVSVPGGVTDELAAALGSEVTLLRCVAVGRSGGLRVALGVCTSCGEPCMVTATKARRKDGKWPGCRMTPGCDGRHVPVDRDLEASQ